MRSIFKCFLYSKPFYSNYKIFVLSYLLMVNNIYYLNKFKKLSSLDINIFNSDTFPLLSGIIITNSYILKCISMSS